MRWANRNIKFSLATYLINACNVLLVMQSDPHRIFTQSENFVQAQIVVACSLWRCYIDDVIFFCDFSSRIYTWIGTRAARKYATPAL